MYSQYIGKLVAAEVGAMWAARTLNGTAEAGTFLIHYVFYDVRGEELGAAEEPVDVLCLQRPRQSFALHEAHKGNQFAPVDSRGSHAAHCIVQRNSTGAVSSVLRQLSL